MTPWDEHPQWRERDLWFDFSRAVLAYKFDSQDHGMGHLLKAVDFVVEWPRQLWLIEVKDPESGSIPALIKEDVRAGFLQKLESGTLIEKHLFPKLRDTLIYLGMERGIVSKPLRYLVLIGLEKLEPPMLDSLKGRLWRQGWISGPKRGWKKSFDVAVLTPRSWNRVLPYCPVTRISAARSMSNLYAG